MYMYRQIPKREREKVVDNYYLVPFFDSMRNFSRKENTKEMTY